MSDESSDCSEALPKWRISERFRRYRRFELLSDWYGEERAAVEIAAHTAQPRPISVSVDRLEKMLVRPETAQLMKLIQNWKNIIPGMAGVYTEPQSLQNMVLTIKVRHSVLLQELRDSTDLLVKKINETAGETICSVVRLTME